MHVLLTRHPDSRSSAATGIEVDIARSGAQLALRYVVAGSIADLRLPPAARPTRTDELWKHTCFEAFVRAGPSPAYYEFNFSPSTQWAAYGFTTYRSGMSTLNDVTSPQIEVQSDAHRLQLKTVLDLNALPGLADIRSWRVALSAVTEEADTGLSYWALAHPPGKPDFHHADCFALELIRA